MIKKTGYIVKYRSGYYEDYREYTVAIYINKEAAENRCKEIDEYYKNPPKPEWDIDDWYEIDKAFYNEFDHPTKIAERYPKITDSKTWRDFDNKEEFSKYLHEKYEEQDRMLEDIVMKFFPTWSREKAREEIDKQEWIEDVVQREEYREAFIEEITIYE